MSRSGIILEYRGPINFSIIESLLKKLKKTKEFADFNKTTGKRLYAIFVECLENISKHSAIKSSNDKRMQPYVSIRKENDKIIIMAGNPVTIDAKDKLVRRLDQINQSDEVALKTLYENKINSDSKQGENGAGLGFIFMALKSGKINYNFTCINNDFSYFEIEISLNKYIMRKLIIDQTSCSPKVILDPEKKIYHISGESRPPDVREFYDQILSWLDDFSLYLIKSDEKKDPVTFNFNFEYFNSSSGKFILDICKVLAGLRLKGVNITVNWHFEKDDIDMLEVGKEMSRIVKFPFEYIETKAIGG
ncbi:MAG: SiaB family protein kinase [Bacteroidales bacterium]|nr:SiaB family protein kinase [Bacteroidales bacterium]